MPRNGLPVLALSALLACASAAPPTAPPEAEPVPSPVPLPRFTPEERTRLIGPVTLDPPRIGVDQEAERRRLQWTVIVRGIIDVDGRVQVVDALKALPFPVSMELVERGLREARYQPAQLDGRAVPIGAVWIIVVDAKSPPSRVVVDEPRWPAQ